MLFRNPRDDLRPYLFLRFYVHAHCQLEVWLPAREVTWMRSQGSLTRVDNDCTFSMFDHPRINWEPIRPGSTKENLADAPAPFSTRLRNLNLDAARLEVMYSGQSITPFVLQPDS